MNRRVVITGMGAVTPFGDGVEKNWQALLAKKSAISLITEFDTTELKTKIAGMCRNFDHTPFFSDKDKKRMDKVTQFASAASHMAYQDAHLEQLDSAARDNTGVILGTIMGGYETLLGEQERLLKSGPRRISPYFIPKTIPNLMCAQIAINYGFKGANFSVSSSCASSGHAIALSYLLINQGINDIMLSGGSEAIITPLTIAGFNIMNAMSVRNDAPEKASRPFDKDRDGIVISEGAGVLIMESLESAQKRGVKIYAEVLGMGMSDDAYHLVSAAPDSYGYILCMERALKNARVNPAEISYINAHACSTPAGDHIEARAIKGVFGKQTDNITVTSTKSQLGHLQGAAGAVELIATILSINTGLIPPTLNLENKDPQCEIDILAGDVKKAEINTAISNSFGFGGHNVTLVIGKYREQQL